MGFPSDKDKGWRDEPRSLMRKIVRARDGNELGMIEAIDGNRIVVKSSFTDDTLNLPFDFLDHIQGKTVFLKVNSGEVPKPQQADIGVEGGKDENRISNPAVEDEQNEAKSEPKKTAADRKESKKPRSAKSKPAF